MYDVETTLAAIDDKAVLACILGAGAFLANWTYFYTCARDAARDRTQPMALWAIVLFMAHDSSYLLKGDHWWTDFEGMAGNWMLPLFYVGLIVTFVLECVFFVQAIKWGRKDHALGIPDKLWTAYCIGALVTGIIFFHTVKATMDDPIYIVTFIVTYGMCAPATFTLIAKRRNVDGMSPVQEWAYLIIGVFFVALTYFVIGGPFAEGWLLVASIWVIVMAAGLVATFYIVGRRTAGELPEQPATVSANAG